MIRRIADNIISPLGSSSDENFKAVFAGETALRKHEYTFGLSEPFCGSLIDRNALQDLFNREVGEYDDYSFFEKLCILSASKAIRACNLSAREPNVLFILSTTKGNVDYLATNVDDTACYLSSSADKITKFFGNTNSPIVVSNACISGVCAQITAVRALLCHTYKYAVVIGCDVLSKFIISGFQSFKALSPEQCRPYDKERVGLNLGEAVGTLILERSDKWSDSDWLYEASSIHNDANHISGPSRTGEGSYRVLNDILATLDKENIAFVNAHGTATSYNDEMESIAIHRAELDDVPINGLKGFYGHTLGAAGIIETVLSMKAVDNRVILPTLGYANCGTSHKLSLSRQARSTEKKAFVKILSGFGGCNAGIAWQKGCVK